MEEIKRKRVVVFLLTFLSYALYHASRKNLSGVKASITNEWMDNGTRQAPRQPLFSNQAEAQAFLGTLDALFMIFYAGALVYWGWLGDRLNPVKVVVFGMVGSAIALSMFGYLPHVFSFYSISYYLIVYAAFGIVQACGWPNEVTVMAGWFDRSNRGLIMGVWAACQPVGNILGALFVSFILPIGYVYTFIFNSILITFGAVFLYLFVQPKPTGNLNAQLSRQSSTDSSSSTSSDINLDNTVVHNRRQNLSLFEAMKLPTVLPYCLCNACLKFVNYAFFFWLPYYLTHKFGWPESEANQLSVFYDFGGIIGSVVGGFLSDRLRFRSPILMLMLIGSLPLLFIYAELGPDQIMHIVMMTCLGATISGPYNLIVGTISVDLGSQPALAGNTDAMSTVTGLIDGTGSAGSAVGQLFVPLIQNDLGWAYVFYLFIIMNILSSACLLKRFLRDCHTIWKSRQLGIEVVETEIVTNRIEHSPLLP